MCCGWAFFPERLNPNSTHLKALDLKAILKDDTIMKSYIISEPILLNNTIWKYT